MEYYNFQKNIGPAADSMSVFKVYQSGVDHQWGAGGR